MKKYYYIRKNDKGFEVLGYNFNFSRKYAALYFCAIKRIHLKDFLKIYTVYPDLNLNKKLFNGALIKIESDSNIATYKYEGNKFTLMFSNIDKTLNLKHINKYMTFYHFINFIKSYDYKIKIVN